MAHLTRVQIGPKAMERMRPPATAPHRQSRIAIGAALLAVWMLVADLGALAHQALVQHAVCSEHGESIHVSQSDDAASPTAEPSTRAELHRHAPGNSGDAHEHCSIDATAATTTPPAAPAFTPTRTPATSPRALLTAALPPRLATFRLAPKTSPPA